MSQATSILDEMMEHYSPEEILKDLKSAIKASESGKERGQFSNLYKRSAQILGEGGTKIWVLPNFMTKYWIDGKGIPQPAVRRMIYQYLQGKIKRMVAKGK